MAPPPISPASLMVWCGERNGRVPTSPRESSSTPATLWMRVVSMASSSDIGGRIVGMRLASIVFPAPGGPMKIMLWLPAQATSSARLAACCPRTSRISTAYCAASASIEPRVHAHRRERFRRIDQIHGLRQRFHGEDVDAFDHGRLARVRLRHHHGLDPVLARRQRRRKRAAHRAHAAIERQFAQENILIEALAEKRSLAAQNPKRHRQIERRTFLANVGGRQIHGDALQGKIEAAILQRGLDAFAAFLHRDVRQAHDVEIARASRADVHLHLDQVGVDAKHRGAECFEVHMSTDVTSSGRRKSNPISIYSPE